MLAAVVRFQESHELVGLFVYTSMSDFFWLVDECCDPYECEYLNIEYGGVFFPKKADKLLTDSDSSDYDYVTLLNQKGDSLRGDDMTAELTCNLQPINDSIVELSGWHDFEYFRKNNGKKTKQRN
tara:strand:+ start:143 stop:517 length:375 start_codon:yes stop_codon:yes gene_type:complete